MMITQDLIDFFLENDRWKKIGPLNKIKTSILTATKYQTDFFQHNMSTVRDEFKDIGTCESTTVTKSEQLEKLSRYWYWPSSKKQIGFSEYLNEFRKKNTSLPDYVKIYEGIQSLRQGWNDEIEIIVAFHTHRDIGLIVDGTHRSLILDYIRQEELTLLEELLKKSGSVKICMMYSSQCDVIFHNDFH